MTVRAEARRRSARAAARAARTASRSSDGDAARSIRLRAGEERELDVTLRCTPLGRATSRDGQGARPRPVPPRDLGEPGRRDAPAEGVPAPAHAPTTARADRDAGVRRQPGRARRRATGSSTRTSATSCRATASGRSTGGRRRDGRGSSSTSAIPSATPTSSSSSTASPTCATATAASSTTPCGRPPRSRRATSSAAIASASSAFGGVLRWLQPGMGIDPALPPRRDAARDRRRADVHVARRQRHPGADPPAAARSSSRSRPLVDPRFVAALEDLRGRRFDVAVVEVDPVPLVRARPDRGRARALPALAPRARGALRGGSRARGIGIATWGDGALDTVLEEVRTFRRYARAARV